MEHFFILSDFFFVCGFAESEPTLSRACCSDADLYCSIGKFRSFGRMDPEFNVPQVLDAGRPAHWLHLTSCGRADRRTSPPGEKSERRSGSNRALAIGLCPHVHTRLTRLSNADGLRRLLGQNNFINMGYSAGA